MGRVKALTVLVAAVTFAAAAFTFSAFAEKAEQFDVLSLFSGSGFMGDGESCKECVKLEEACTTDPHSGPNCVKLTYKPDAVGWAGIYWLNEPDNWGDKAGMDFSKSKYDRVSFWAKGEKGGESVEFKAGKVEGPGKQYKDSFGSTTGKIVLEKNWKNYTIDLKGKDLSSVIGGFCWVASKTANSGGLTFYIDDVYYESSK